MGKESQNHRGIRDRSCARPGVGLLPAMSRWSTCRMLVQGEKFLDCGPSSPVTRRVNPKATLQDVATRVGVHRTTVSLALRDHPRIPAATRERVKTAAAKLGYRSNPLVSALMKSRRSGRAVKHVALAYVTNYPTRFGWRPPHHDRPDYFRERCKGRVILATNLNTSGSPSPE